MPRGRALGALFSLSLAVAAVTTAEAATGLSFLKTGVGARAVALGDAVVSHVDDASASYWNPGALPLLTGSNLALTHNEAFQGVRQESASLTAGRGAFGGALAFSGVWVDNLRGYDESGQFEGHFGYYGLSVSLGAGYAVSERIGIGAGLEFLREAVDEFSTGGVAFNLGAQAREVLPRTDVGISVLHLGSSMKYEAESFDLPTAVQGGVTHRLPVAAMNGQFLVAAEFRKVRDEDSQVLLGSEYRYQDLASLQVGYRSAHDTEDVSLGIGVGSGTVQGQYAFVPSGDDLGDQHRISLLLRW